MALRYSSDVPGGAPSDMFTVVVAKSSWHPIGRRIGSLFTWINKSYSTGQVRLRSASPREQPEVAFQLLSDPRDMVRMKAALLRMRAFYAAPGLAAAAAGNPQGGPARPDPHQVNARPAGSRWLACAATNWIVSTSGQNPRRSDALKRHHSPARGIHL